MKKITTNPQEVNHHETTRHRHSGPRGRGENHPVRGPALHRRGHPRPGTGGPPGRLSGHPRPGAGPGHHHLLQAGPVPDPRAGGHPPGHPRPCGLLRRDGAHPPGAGLRHPGHQRHRRGPGPHGDPVAAAPAQPDPHLPLCHQDGPAQPRPGGYPGRAPAAAGRGVRRLHPPGRGLGRGGGPPGRGAAGPVPGDRPPDPPGRVGAGPPGPALPLLLRRGPPAGGGGGLSPGPDRLHRGPGLSPGLRRPGL